VQLAAIQVVKRDGRREDFIRDKLLGGLRKACSKREVSVAQLDLIAADIEAQLIADGRPEVESTCIGELAMDALRGLDHIAYIRFASVYRPFADLASLKEAVLALEDAHEAPPAPSSVQLVLPGTHQVQQHRGPRATILRPVPELVEVG
jgi:transcriptional repressor NrdR